MRITRPAWLHHLLLPKLHGPPVSLPPGSLIVSTAPRAEAKCSFVGHAARVNSVTQALIALSQILALRKVNKASHNILAYRISPCPTSATPPPTSSATRTPPTPLSGFDHDGESPAGSRLLRILELRDDKDVLVVVTRWYGGSPLGNKRFRAIDAAGREALDLLLAKEAGEGGGVRGADGGVTGPGGAKGRKRR